MSMAALERRAREAVGQAGLVPEARRAAYAVDGAVPAVVALPATIDELSALLREAHEARAVVVPWGGGTKQSMGGVLPRVDLVVGLSRLARLLDHEPADLTASFEAGIRLADANAHLGKANQWLALDPPHGDRCTVGGVLATNASGPHRLRYGTARDLVIGIRVVHADGTITKGGARVVKNVTGYDMNKLYIGSLGTLAVIAEVTVKLYPRPIESRTWLVTFPSLEAAAGLVARVVDSHLLPHALEIVSAGAAPALPGGAGDNVPAGGVLLAAAFGGITEEVASQIATVRGMAAGTGADHDRLLDGEAEAAFWDGIRNFAARLGAPVGASADAGPTAWAVARASLVLTAVPKVLAAAEAARAAHRLDAVAAAAEAATGSARLALAGPPDRLATALRDLREAAAQGGPNAGHLVVEQAPPAVRRAIDPWGPAGPSLRLMQALKAQFDPDRRLNPGRFVGGI